MTLRMFNFIFVAVLIFLVFMMLVGRVVDAQSCECICEPTATPALVLPEPVETMDAQTWWDNHVD